MNVDISKFSELERINIEKIEDKYGTDYIITSKGDMMYNCPFCEEKRGKIDNDHKFGINCKSGLGFCFKCHTKVVTFKYNNSNSEKVIPFLFDYFNVNNDCKEEIPTPELIELKDVCKLTKDSLGYEYLRDRGITNEQIDYYNLMNGMGNHLGRIIIPNLLIGKWTDFYQGRSYIGAKNKYSNPKNVDKTNIVFNLHNQTKGQKDFYLVEGAFDAIRGGYDVGSIYGSSISEVQVKLLNSYNFKNLHCCLDGDSAGQLGNNKMAEELLKNTNSNIYICKLPEDRDVGDMGEEEFKEYVDKHERLYINKKLNNILGYFD